MSEDPFALLYYGDNRIAHPEYGLIAYDVDAPDQATARAFCVPFAWVFRASPTTPATTRHDGLDALTGREREVLALIGHGLSNLEIAGRLNVSEGTVKTHINHIFTKLNLRDRPAAIVLAHDHNLVGQRRP
jgi:DNA-binding NarL/FixJ family response regulator